jgi:hypothetical protein
MATTTNTTHKNKILDAIGARFNSGSCVIRSGAAPGAGNAATGTVLATIPVPATAFAAAAAASMSKTGTWQDTSADATGTPGYFRLISSDGLEIREGTAGASGTDMILSGLVGGDIIAGSTVTVTGYTITQS